ncbi:MAG: L-2-hydroxyglutarate oxidase [Actinomycetota bacterium]|nr:L-2-hydroxyglutarate oxidase [Actinomycetota bacterium]
MTALAGDRRVLDFVVIGGGIVGLSTAKALLGRYPGARLAVLEKESGWARHQTGHNSGVIHSGIYYKPGSLKARFCREGARALVELCLERGIEYEICGKVIVATEPHELPLLESLRERGLKNGLAIEKLDSEQLREAEPHASGLAALRVPSTGIVDYKRVAAAFAALVREKGGELRTGTAVQKVSGRGPEVEVHTNRGAIRARTLVNCAGLHSDRVARLCGVDPGTRIVPFRGEYYELRRERRHLVKSLIYPVPNPNFPFLGVHFTRSIDGMVEAGPNAVLGLAREGYKKTDFVLKDFVEALSYPALWRLARKNWRTGLGEIHRSLSKRAFVHGLQKLVPEVGTDDVVPIAAGVRAQALTKEGKLVDDFLISEGENSVHVLNAPSPAATAAIPIGEEIARRVAEA